MYEVELFNSEQRRYTKAIDVIAKNKNDAIDEAKELSHSIYTKFKVSNIEHLDVNDSENFYEIAFMVTRQNLELDDLPLGLPLELENEIDLLYKERNKDSLIQSQKRYKKEQKQIAIKKHFQEIYQKEQELEKKRFLGLSFEEQQAEKDAYFCKLLAISDSYKDTSLCNIDKRDRKLFKNHLYYFDRLTLKKREHLKQYLIIRENQDFIFEKDKFGYFVKRVKNY